MGGSYGCIHQGRMYAQSMPDLQAVHSGHVREAISIKYQRFRNTPLLKKKSPGQIPSIPETRSKMGRIISLSLYFSVSTLINVVEKYVNPTEVSPPVGMIDVLLIDLSIGKVTLH